MPPDPADHCAISVSIVMYHPCHHSVSVDRETVLNLLRATEHIFTSRSGGLVNSGGGSFDAVDEEKLHGRRWLQCCPLVPQIRALSLMCCRVSIFLSCKFVASL